MRSFFFFPKGKFTALKLVSVIACVPEQWELLFDVCLLFVTFVLCLVFYPPS